MMKRTYDQAFGNQPGVGDVLGDVTFKYLQSRTTSDAMKPCFVPANCSSGFNMDDSRGMNYETYLNMEECAVMAAAHDIENKRDDTIEPQVQEPRQIKRVKRRIPITLHQNSQPSPAEDEPVPDPALQGVDLDEKQFEKFEIEFLEKLSADCKFQISKEKAYIMKKYTDLLINAVTTEKASEMKRSKAENIVLKKAFKIQNDMVQKSKRDCEQIQTENTTLRTRLEQMLYENRLMASKLREYQQQELRVEYPSQNDHSGWGGGDVAGC
jgi:hypothetical protein